MVGSLLFSNKWSLSQSQCVISAPLAAQNAIPKIMVKFETYNSLSLFISLTYKLLASCKSFAGLHVCLIQIYIYLYEFCLVPQVTQNLHTFTFNLPFNMTMFKYSTLLLLLK